MYYETSFGYSPDVTLTSECLDISTLTNPALRFYYHMYGATIGTLDVTVNGDTVWSLAGDQGDQWYQAQVDLSAYAGTDITVAFIGAYGGSYTGDMALDNIEVDELAISGCTDPTAANYDPTATFDDGSCTYVMGCTDPSYANYDPLATMDDGSCAGCLFNSVTVTMYDSWGDGWNGNTYTITDSTGAVVATGGLAAGSLGVDTLCLPDGCYDITVGGGLFPSEVSFDFGTLVGAPVGTYTGQCFPAVTPVYGCTDPTALNYDSTATIDDGSCIAIVYGCTDSTATNYYPGANVDDGSCTYSTTCSASPITNLGVTDIIHNRATFTFDDMNTSTCRVDQLRIKYREVGTTAWSQKNMGSPTGYDPVTGICNSTSRTDKLVLGLSANTTYEWQMRVWYCSTGATAWVNGPNFTTLADCPNVGNLAVTTPTSTKATFTWDDSNGAYSFVRLQARVDTTGSSFFNIGGVGVPYGTYTKDKNGLVPGTSYRAKSRTWCDPNGGAYKAPSWTTFIYFTMPGSVRLDGGVSIDNLDVYPNPSRDIFNVSFTSEDAQDLEVRVINVVGEVVYTENLEQFTGEYNKEIDLVTYTKGVYFLEITTENGVVNKKLILQ